MKGKLFKLYDRGKLMDRAQLVFPDVVEVYSHSIYSTVYAIYDSETVVIQDAIIHLIAPNGIRIMGVECIDGVFYKQDLLLEVNH